MRIRSFLVVLTLLSSTGIEAATITDRNIEIHLSPNGMREISRTNISIEEDGDLLTWGEHPIFVDDHIDLVDVAIEVTNSQGKRVDLLKRRDLRKETSVGFGLHSSSSAMIADLPTLSIGDRVSISVIRRLTPLYLADWEPILVNARQDNLSIRITGGGASLRWKLRNADDLVEVVESEDGIHFQGRDLPRREVSDGSGDLLSVGPALVYAWDTAEQWPEVGEWYQELTSQLGAATVNSRHLAETLTKDLENPREKMLALADYARLKIRYEAVEIGAGGWIPTPADEVLARGWGDCKDKSQFLKELLAVIGIKAHLVLIHNGREAMIDPNFPSTLGFNHCIVAVETDGFQVSPTDSVVDGLMFFDPTFDRGASEWLSPHIQGQWALVTAGENGRLLQLPVRHREEGRVMRVEGVINEEGAFNGVVRLRLTGYRAIGWLRDLDSVAPARIEESARRVFHYLLPSLTVDTVAWREIEGPIPSLAVEAVVRCDRFVRSGRSRRLRFSFLNTLPEPRELDERDNPMVVIPGINLTEWKLSLPKEWCLPAADEFRISNSIGSINQTVELEKDGRAAITRTTVVFRSWIGVESFDHLRELATAENRLSRKSMRMECPKPD